MSSNKPPSLAHHLDLTPIQYNQPFNDLRSVEVTAKKTPSTFAVVIRTTVPMCVVIPLDAFSIGNSSTSDTIVPLVGAMFLILARNDNRFGETKHSHL